MYTGNRCKRSTGEDHGNSCLEAAKTDYLLTIQRKENVPTPTPTEVPEVFGPWKTISAATVFSPAVQMRTSNKGRKEKRTVGKKADTYDQGNGYPH